MSRDFTRTIEDTEYVVVRRCRHVVIQDSDDVQVHHASHLRVASINTWAGEPPLMTEGDVGALLRAHDHEEAKR